MDLPEGTLTFLFTDIEGSTRLWEQNPTAMSAVLAQHDLRMHEAIAVNGGHVFKTVGDAFCAVFATVQHALSAAIQAQFSLRSLDDLSPLPPLRVRMALHTGNAETRNNDYFGLTLNRCSRLLAIGYGGQILISEATSQLAQDALPSEVTLLPLGEHRLKDLSRPESVHQVVHPDLSDGFPSLKSLDNPELANNLPIQVTPFVGRENEIAETRRLLKGARLVSIVGGAGSGKTRLALQVAAETLENDGDNVWLIELAPVSAPESVVPILATVLGIREQPGQPLLQTVLIQLRHRQMVLILDNCEHLLAACAQLAGALLRSCSGVQILVTSREPLGISGETIYRIPGLSVPKSADAAHRGQLLDSEAVRLFVARAEAVSPGFVLTEQNARPLVEICRRLDGIPLAIELAAARIRALTVEQIDERLSNCFRLLKGGAKDLAPRQQTLQATIDWSYALLSDQERILLSRLSVFAGGWSLAAAEQICAGGEIEGEEILDLLSNLIDKSLVVADQETSQIRYRLLEIVRQYGAEKLVEGEDFVSQQQQHFAFYAPFVSEANTHLSQADQATWLQALDTELDNLRKVLAYSEEVCSAGDRLKIAGQLGRFWLIRGYWTEGRHWLESLLQEVGSLSDVTLMGVATNVAGILALQQADHVSADRFFQRSLHAKRTNGDLRGQAATLGNLGLVAKGRGDYMAAYRLESESLAIRRSLGDKVGIANSLCNLGLIAYDERNTREARTYFEESLEILRGLGDTRGIAMCLANRGLAWTAEGCYAEAYSDLMQSAALLEQIGDLAGMVPVDYALAERELLLDNLQAAWEHNERGILKCKDLGERRGLAEALWLKSRIAERSGDFATQMFALLESAELSLLNGDFRSAAKCVATLAGAVQRCRRAELEAELSRLERHVFLTTLQYTGNMERVTLQTEVENALALDEAEQQSLSDQSVAIIHTMRHYLEAWWKEESEGRGTREMLEA